MCIRDSPQGGVLVGYGHSPHGAGEAADPLTLVKPRRGIFAHVRVAAGHDLSLIHIYAHGHKGCAAQANQRGEGGCLLYTSEPGPLGIVQPALRPLLCSHRRH